MGAKYCGVDSGYRVSNQAVIALRFRLADPTMLLGKKAAAARDSVGRHSEAAGRDHGK
jgi:hypothetical protein